MTRGKRKQANQQETPPTDIKTGADVDRSVVQARSFGCQRVYHHHGDIYTLFALQAKTRW